MTIGQGSTRHNENCLSKHDVNQCLGFSLGYSPLYTNLELVANRKVYLGRSWPGGPEPYENYEKSMTADAATQMDGKYGVGHDLGDASGLCADLDPIVPIPVQLQDEQGRSELTVGPIFMIDLSYFRSVVGKPGWHSDLIFSNVVNSIRRNQMLEVFYRQESTFLPCAFFKHDFCARVINIREDFVLFWSLRCGAKQFFAMMFLKITQKSVH